MNLTVYLFRPVMSHCLLALSIATATATVAGPRSAGGSPLQQQAEGQQESRQNVERLFAAVVRNPRFGSSFDRVIRWHNQQGSLAQLQAQLADFDSSVRGDSSPPSANAASVLPIPRQCTDDAALLLAGMIALHLMSRYLCWSERLHCDRPTRWRPGIWLEPACSRAMRPPPLPHSSRLCSFDRLEMTCWICTENTPQP